MHDHPQIRFTPVERSMWCLLMFLSACVGVIELRHISMYKMLLVELSNEFSCIYNTHQYYYLNVLYIVIRNLLLANIDCFLLGRSHRPKSLSLFQKKELMKSFLNNSKLTYNDMMKLSCRLGVTPGQVKYFFQLRSKIPRNVNIEAYSKLTQGKASKGHFLNQNMHA